MQVTYSCIYPDVSPMGVLDEIPRSEWNPAIAAAERELGVRLGIRHHASVDEIPHYHFDITGDEDKFPAALPRIASLLADVLDVYTRRVTLPESK